MPKSHSHGIWQRLQQFLESEEEQEELREQKFGKVSSMNRSHLFNIGYVTCCIKLNKSV